MGTEPGRELSGLRDRAEASQRAELRRLEKQTARQLSELEQLDAIIAAHQTQRAALQEKIDGMLAEREQTARARQMAQPDRRRGMPFLPAWWWARVGADMRWAAIGIAPGVAYAAAGLDAAGAVVILMGYVIWMVMLPRFFRWSSGR